MIETRCEERKVRSWEVKTARVEETEREQGSKGAARAEKKWQSESPRNSGLGANV